VYFWYVAGAVFLTVMVCADRLAVWLIGGERALAARGLERHRAGRPALVAFTELFVALLLLLAIATIVAHNTEVTTREAALHVPPAWIATGTFLLARRYFLSWREPDA
jgi:hypothetical protein